MAVRLGRCFRCCWRARADVTLLEAHPDFDREFRGDTIHPSVMEIMDQLGLADKLLELRHTEIRSATVQTDAGPFRPLDLSHLNTKYPYITMMPQKDFLEFITGEADRYPNFRLVMSARARELEEDGVVRGVRYEAEDGWHEVRAVLTVGADGRGSRMRRLAGFELKKTSPPMDILWFKLPREPDDPEGAMGRVGRGHIAILLDRFDYWHRLRHPQRRLSRAASRGDRVAPAVLRRAHTAVRGSPRAPG